MNYLIRVKNMKKQMIAIILLFILQWQQIKAIQRQKSIFLKQHPRNVKSFYTISRKDPNNDYSLFWAGYRNEMGGNYTIALEYYNKALEKHNIPSMIRLGYMYENGRSVARDYDKALEFYDFAASCGHYEALVSIGYMYEKGIGMSQNLPRARRYYEIAIEKGNIEALVNLGIIYERYDNDLIKARKCYEIAIKKGSIKASHNLDILKSKCE
jgi:TPR repeat protein